MILLAIIFVESKTEISCGAVSEMHKMSDSFTLPDMCLKSYVAGEREEELVEEPQLLKDEEEDGTLLHWAAR